VLGKAIQTNNVRREPRNKLKINGIFL